MLEQLILNTVVQWLLFLVIPVLVYLIFFRKKTKFLLFLGLKKHEKTRNGLLLKLSIISIVYVAISIFWANKYNMGGDDIRLLSFQKTGLSIKTLMIIFIQSIIQTSFLEEIVFRGFLINAFKDKLGFNSSNHIQAVIFTGIHVLAMLSFSLVDMVLGTVMIYILSVYFGKITKESGYSVFYSSVFHGVLNVMAGFMFILMNILV